MGRKAFFSKEEIFEAADTLVAGGKEVTATALLNILGGGSFTTIYRHLKAWQDERPELVVPNRPAEIPEQVQTAFSSAWKVAMNEAARETSAVKEKAAAEVKAAQRQLEEALGQIDRLESESEADSEKIEGLSARVVELEAAFQKAQSDATSYKATAEQLKHQVRSQESELERMHAELDKERSKHRQEVEKLTQAAETAADKATQEIEALKKELGEVRGQARQMEKERDDTQSKLEATQKQLEKSEQTAKSDRAERDAAFKEAAQYKGQLDSLHAQNKDLLGRLAEGKPASKAKK
ncbi:MAG: DNA-binding protein [Cyanobacteriota/Melainabacteria group bacterium]